MNMQAPYQIEAQVEALEVISLDYALAYAALARRVAAVDAYIQAGMEQHANSIRAEIEDAMRVIAQAETSQAVIKPSSEEHCNVS